MDGLMFDTERLAARCWSQVGKELGIHVTEEVLSHARGLTGPEYRLFLEQSLGEQFDYELASSRKRDLFWSYIKKDGLAIKPGLLALLNFLRNENFCIAMATATRREIALHYLNLTGVQSYFDFLVFGDQVTHGKPNPEIFLLAARQANSLPQECIVLEDSINGIKAGIAGGFHTIMVPDITQPTPNLETQLSFRCDTLDQVIPYLQANKDSQSQRFLL